MSVHAMILRYQPSISMILEFNQAFIVKLTARCVVMTAFSFFVDISTYAVHYNSLCCQIQLKHWLVHVLNFL